MSLLEIRERERKYRRMQCLFEQINVHEGYLLLLYYPIIIRYAIFNIAMSIYKFSSASFCKETMDY